MNHECIKYSIIDIAFKNQIKTHTWYQQPNM